MNKYTSLISLLKEFPLFDTDKNPILFKEHFEKYEWAQYHSFIENFYNKEFSKYVDYANVKVCEIGIDRGGSIALWSKYFETNGTILGIDISPNNITPQYHHTNFNNVIHLITDAYNPALVNCLSNFDIIIDDGPHTLQSQIDFINLYLNKLNPGGVMIIEDVPDINWIYSFQTLIPADHETEIVDLRETDNRYDSLLFVIRKRETNE